MVDFLVIFGVVFGSGLMGFAIGYYQGERNALVECRKLEERIEDCPRCCWEDQPWRRE